MPADRLLDKEAYLLAQANQAVLTARLKRQINLALWELHEDSTICLIEDRTEC